VRDVGQVITEAWSFLLGPVINLGCLVFLVVFLAKERGQALVGWLQIRRLPDLGNERLEKSLERYGVSKLLPLAALFAVLFLLYACQVGVGILGDFAPVALEYNPTQTLIHTDRVDNLLSLWS